MATLIPEITLTEFKKLRPEQLKELKSCEVTFNCYYLFTFVNPQTDFIRISVENLAQLGNALSGKTIEQLGEKEELNACRE